MVDRYSSLPIEHPSQLSTCFRVTVQVAEGLSSTFSKQIAWQSTSNVNLGATRSMV